MREWKNTLISEFMKERPGRYKPNDPKVANLTRLEKIDFSGKLHFSNKSSKTNMIIAKKGDLVVSGINVSKGAVAVYEGEEDVTATIHYSSYTFDKQKIDVEYFKRFLKSPKFIQLLKEQVKGGIKTEIKPKHLLPLKIDLPDLDTQKSIVNFFEKTENKITHLNREINNQVALLKQFRQSILQEAVEGKLTADWRKQHPELISGENHVARLLEKIKAEKERLVKEGKIKKQKPLPPISEEEKPFELPEGWVWSRLGEVGIVNPRNFVEDSLEVSFIPMANISEKYGVNPTFEIKPWRDIKKGFTHFAESDIGLAKITPCFENSKSCVFANLKNGFGAGTTELHVLRLVKNFLESHYVYLFLKTPKFLKEGEKIMTGTAGQKRVPVSYFENAVFPLPPLSEQQSIVEKVNRLMAKIDALEEQVKERKEQAEQLMQAVLREAFNSNS